MNKFFMYLDIHPIMSLFWLWLFFTIVALITEVCRNFSYWKDGLDITADDIFFALFISLCPLINIVFVCVLLKDKIEDSVPVWVGRIWTPIGSRLDKFLKTVVIKGKKRSPQVEGV